MRPKAIEYLVLAGLSGVLAAIFLLWPGGFALTDRLALGLLFGIPAVVALQRARTRLSA